MTNNQNPQNQQNQKSQNQNQNQKPQDKRSGMKEDPSVNDDSNVGNRTSKY